MDEYKAKLQNIISSHFTITDTSKQGLEEAAQLVQDVADSFGGCVKCWGKGYTYQQTSSAMKHGSTLVTTDAEWCDCLNGELLKLGLTRSVMFEKCLRS